jgi:hypothetical protein
MESVNKNCQNCKTDFVIESEDFQFYEKIRVPPPTFCPECRQRRRMSFRNERTLYKRKCDVTGKDIISIFSADSPHKVCESAYWYSDQFDPLSYSRDFDFNRSFFEQFHELSLSIPLPSLRLEASENCDYNNDMSRSKNCYLCARTHMSQNMLYTYRGNSSSFCGDCMQVVENSEYLYECVECVNCRDGKYLYFSENCANSAFLWNCRNCLDCFMCTNLRNKQYCFMNEQLSKDEYRKRREQFDLTSHIARQSALAEFDKLKLKTIRKYATIVNSNNVVGDNIIDSRNAYLCFGLKFAESVRYLWDVMKYKDSMDAYSGGRDSQLIYECTAVAACYNTKFCVRASESTDVQYSYFIKTSKNIFGSIGLQSREYCILNKQYSESDYKELLNNIVEHMKKTGEYGEFFPAKLTPFAYNETVAQDWFPLTPAEAEQGGYRWRVENAKSYDITVPAKVLPDNIAEIGDSILNEVVGCEHTGQCDDACTTAFRIVPQELEFYKKIGVPLPRLCPNCRHHARLKQRNPMKLWHRQCMCLSSEALAKEDAHQNTAEHFHGDQPCPNEFETSYAPDRSEVVYCEACYNAEVA